MTKTNFKLNLNAIRTKG